MIYDILRVDDVAMAGGRPTRVHVRVRARTVPSKCLLCLTACCVVVVVARHVVLQTPAAAPSPIPTQLSIRLRHVVYARTRLLLTMIISGQPTTNVTNRCSRGLLHLFIYLWTIFRTRERLRQARSPPASSSLAQSAVQRHAVRQQPAISRVERKVLRLKRFP